MDRDLDAELARDLDMEIALKVTCLPGVGWYKRRSCRSPENVVASGPKDFTEDYPQWKAARYYLADGGVDEEGVVRGRIFAVPPYSTTWDAAMRVRDRMVADGLGIHLAKRLGEDHGTWLTCTPEDVCRASLAVVGSDAESRGERPDGEWWDEVKARRVAFNVESVRAIDDGRRLLEGAVVALDGTRKLLFGVMKQNDGLEDEIRRIDQVILWALPMGLVLDRRDWRVRALARQRDKLRDLVRSIHERLSPTPHPTLIPELHPDVARTLRDIGEAKVLSPEYDSAPEEVR